MAAAVKAWRWVPLCLLGLSAGCATGNFITPAAASAPTLLAEGESRVSAVGGQSGLQMEVARTFQGQQAWRGALQVSRKDQPEASVASYYAARLGAGHSVAAQGLWHPFAEAWLDAGVARADNGGIECRRNGEPCLILYRGTLATAGLQANLGVDGPWGMLALGWQFEYLHVWHDKVSFSPTPDA